MTAERRYALVRTMRLPASGMCVSEAAARCGVHPDLIDRFIRLGLIDPVERDDRRNEWILAAGTPRLIRKIIRLRNDLGLNYSAIGVVLDLLSRIDLLEVRIRELESRP